MHDPLDKLDVSLGCICVRWSTHCDIGYTIESDRLSRKKDNSEVGSGFGVDQVDTI